MTLSPRVGIALSTWLSFRCWRLYPSRGGGGRERYSAPQQSGHIFAPIA